MFAIENKLRPGSYVHVSRAQGWKPSVPLDDASVFSSFNDLLDALYLCFSSQEWFNFRPTDGYRLVEVEPRKAPAYKAVRAIA